MKYGPRDLHPYRIAITALGVAFVAAIVGAAWVCAEHWCVKNVPVQLWFVVCAVGGVFIGTLIPFSLQRRASVVGGLAVALIGLLAIVLGLTAARHCRGELDLFAIATAAAGVLSGLAIPDPAGQGN